MRLSIIIIILTHRVMELLHRVTTLTHRVMILRLSLPYDTGVDTLSCRPVEYPCWLELRFWLTLTRQEPGRKGRRQWKQRR
jgi:hypothetical protein